MVTPCIERDGRDLDWILDSRIVACSIAILLRERIIALIVVLIAKRSAFYHLFLGKYYLINFLT